MSQTFTCLTDIITILLNPGGGRIPSPPSPLPPKNAFCAGFGNFLNSILQISECSYVAVGCKLILLYFRFEICKDCK